MQSAPHSILEYGRKDPNTRAAGRWIAKWLALLSDVRALKWVVVAGCICRLAQYLSYRSFWNDEALLVLNIRAKSAGALLRGLDLNQAAPPLFLLIERGLYRVIGGSEWSLRLFPLAAGLLALICFARLARLLCPPAWAAAAVGVFAFSDRLIWHANEVKPYSSDVFVTVLMLLAAMEKSGTGFRRRLMISAGLACVAVWLSYPAIFVFVGVSLLLLSDALRGGWSSLAPWLIANIVVIASFAGVLVLTVHNQQSNVQLVGYWTEDFADLSHPARIPLWLAQRLFGACAYPAPLAGPVVAGLGLLAMVCLVRRTEWGRLGVLAGPVAAVILAAGAHRYPFDGARLTAFLTPALLLLAGLGGAALPSWRGELAPGILITWLIAASATSAAWHLVYPRTRTHVRPAIAYVRARMQPGDGVYALAEREFDCYWPAADPRVRYAMDRADEIPFQRFWVVCSYPNKAGLKRLQPLLQWAGVVATRRGAGYTGVGAGAYLFERTGAEAVSVHSLEPPSVETHHKMIRPPPGTRPEATGEDVQ